MRFEGQIKRWNDDRGFGFIEPINGGQEIFAHIKAFPTSFGRPTIGTKVTFEVEAAPDSKKRAVKVQPFAATKSIPQFTTKRAPANNGWELSSIVALLIFSISYLILTAVWNLSIYVGAAYLGMSIVCAGFYWHDKVSAKMGEWRTSEETLIVLGLLGGWPGAIVAQQVLRHKTTKQSFRVMHWFTVGLNLGVLLLVGTPLLRIFLQRYAP